MKQFSSWYPLTEEGIQHAPEAEAAIQIKVADGLVDYETGKSAMVCYFFAADRADRALAERFSDEVESPGARGLGELKFRILEGEQLQDTLADLLFKFVRNFGEPPLYNRHPDE